MAFLTAAVAVVGVLCLLDLLLTFGVIRRLREHTEIIGSGAGPRMRVTDLVGAEQMAAFTAVTSNGLSLSETSGLRMVAFFSSSCSVCPERIEPFAAYLTDHHVEPDSVLSVVAGQGSDPVPYLSRLTEFSLVCVEGHDGELAKAFKIVGFPAFCLLDTHGAIRAASYDPALLPEPVTAR